MFDGETVFYPYIPLEDDDSRPKGSLDLVVIENRIRERFEVLGELCDAMMEARARSTIVTGPAGLGKTFMVEKKLTEWDPEGNRHCIARGYAKATGLYKLAYKYRFPGSIIALDDTGSIWTDPDSLDMLKALCDTTKKRQISWLSEFRPMDENGEPIPNTFEFEGGVIFISNVDFDAVLASNRNALTPHIEAMISRSHYINMGMRDRIDFLVRIRMVIRESGMLDHVPPEKRAKIMAYMVKNMNKIRSLDLRMAMKLGDIITSSTKDWVRLANVTCLRPE